MKCADVTNALLEGELEELLGGESPVSAHVKTCASCRAAADHLLGRERALRATVASVRGPRTADEVVDAVFANVDRDAGVSREGRERLSVRPLRRRSRVIRWTALTMAAAAAVMLVVLQPGGRLKGAIGTTGQSASTAEVPLTGGAPSTALAVEVPPGRNAVVFEKTRNPNISVVWIY